MRYYIVTYGCQMNKSDSERIASVLEKISYKRASNINEADLIVVNMCSVRQSAVDRVYGLSQKFKKLKTKNPHLKILLTGCVLNEDKQKFKKHFDSIFNIKDLKRLPNLLTVNEAGSRCRDNYLKIIPRYQTSFSAFVPIMTGCNNFCSYCVVPYTKGREISRPAEEILSEVKNLVKKGYKEVWLLGQNVNSYGVQRETDAKQNAKLTRKINFAKLLKMINDIPGNFWIRFTSPHPKDFSDELIETMAKCRKVTPYLNLPVQSGDDEILKRMNRTYSIKHYKNLVKKIRSAFKKYRKAPGQDKFATGQGLEKGVAISTDVIVGFPGETKKQFENTVKLFKEIKYDMAYIAKYSPRPGTAASKLKDDVPPQEKEKRWKILTEILKKTALEKNKRFIEKEIEVLIEEQKNGFLIGKSRHYKTAKLEVKSYKLKADLIGQFIKVKIIDALTWGLKGILR